MIFLVKMLFTCACMCSLYIDNLALKSGLIAAQLIFMYPSTKRFVKNPRTFGWMFYIDAVALTPLFINVANLSEEYRYALAALYVVCLQQNMELLNVPIVGYLADLFVCSLKLVIPVIFSVLMGFFVVYVLQIQPAISPGAKSNTITSDFLTTLQILSSIGLNVDMNQIKLQANEYIVILLLITLILVKVIFASSILMIQSIITATETALAKRESADRKHYQLMFIDAFWAAYPAFFNRYFQLFSVVVLE